jgi:hypothetical protein
MVLEGTMDMTMAMDGRTHTRTADHGAPLDHGDFSLHRRMEN